MDNSNYCCPELFVIVCRVNLGFANSFADPNVNPEIDW